MRKIKFNFIYYEIGKPKIHKFYNRRTKTAV